MKEVLSKGKDCKWLAQQLKNKMSGNISFNTFGIDNQILSGVYVKSGFGFGLCYGKEDVRFYIKFCKNEFLRIYIELGCNSNEDITSAMYELINALSSIKQEDTVIGFPLAIYKINNCLTSEYAFKIQEETIEALKNNTMFDEQIENLKFLRTCNNCLYGSYAYEGELGKEPLYCTYGGGCDIETQENETCLNHEFEDGEEPNIKVLCRNICDNKK